MLLVLLVDDLQLERDVLPLFNFTHHEQTEAALRTLFRAYFYLRAEHVVAHNAWRVLSPLT